MEKKYKTLQFVLQPHFGWQHVFPLLCTEGTTSCSQSLLSAEPILTTVDGKAEGTLSVSSHCPCACSWWTGLMVWSHWENLHHGFFFLQVTTIISGTQIQKQAFTQDCFLLSSLAITVLSRPELLWHELMVTAAKSLSQVHFWTSKWGSHQHLKNRAHTCISYCV